VQTWALTLYPLRSADSCVTDNGDTYESFYREAEPRLRRALVAAFGPLVGREATADALAYGWEHWERIGRMHNPVGYLYRVGQTRAMRSRSARTAGFPPPPNEDHAYEPGLADAIEHLSPGQRQAVLLVYAWGYTYREVAELLGVAPSTVQKHLERGLAKLRKSLGVIDDV